MERDRSRQLALLWPHRVHESNWLKALLCAVGFHSWHVVRISPAEHPEFCRRCAEIKTAEPVEIAGEIKQI